MSSSVYGGWTDPERTAGIDHLVGISMGGYIGQLVAIDYPEKVSTLRSLMTGVGGDQMVFGPRPPDDAVEDPIEGRLAEFRAMSGGRYFDATRLRAEVERSMGRAANPKGVRRQAAAIHSASSRAPGLGRLRIPVLVIHGELDPMLPVENAYRTASAVPGSTLIVIPDLGHELPPAVWSEVVGAIALQAASQLDPSHRTCYE